MDHVDSRFAVKHMYPLRGVDRVSAFRYRDGVASVVQSDLRIRPLRRVEYDRLVDLGVFAGERLEPASLAASGASFKWTRQISRRAIEFPQVSA